GPGLLPATCATRPDIRRMQPGTVRIEPARHHRYQPNQFSWTGPYADCAGHDRPVAETWIDRAGRATLAGQAQLEAQPDRFLRQFHQRDDLYLGAAGRFDPGGAAVQPGQSVCLPIRLPPCEGEQRGGVSGPGPPVLTTGARGNAVLYVHKGQ